MADSLTTLFRDTNRKNPNPTIPFQTFRNLNPQFLKGFADTQENRDYYKKRLIRWTQRQDKRSGTNDLYYGAPNGWYKNSATDAYARGISEVDFRPTQKDSTLYNDYWSSHERLQQGIGGGQYKQMYSMYHKENRNILNQDSLTNVFMNPEAAPKHVLEQSLIGKSRNEARVGKKTTEIETDRVDPNIRVSLLQNDLVLSNTKNRVDFARQFYPQIKKASINF